MHCHIFNNCLSCTKYAEKYLKWDWMHISGLKPGSQWRVERITLIPRYR